MADISEYTTIQQGVIKEIISNDNGFHTEYSIANIPFYGMLKELENGQLGITKNVSSSLSLGSTDYNLQISYSEEQNCWFYNFSYSGEEIRGVIHYNTVFNSMGNIAFAILNDNVNDNDLSSSLPYSNVLVLRK